VRARLPSLRLVLLLDGAASGALGLGLALGAGALAAPLGLPQGLLRGAGLALLPWAVLVLWLCLRTAPPRGAVKAVAAVNLLWVVASLLALLPYGGAATTLGIVFVVGQAIAVAVLAELQLLTLPPRHAARAAPA
jgi:hypothetical protein